jgi:hypothetical protein
MPQFIHLIDERNTSRVRKNGIRAHKIHWRAERGVFCTPVLQNHVLSHQWLRELKRRGIRTVAAVQFRLDDDAPVAVGRYNEDHAETTAAEASRLFLTHADGLGLEVIVSGSISANNITRIYTPNQVVGWRYYPEAHGRTPCGCELGQRGQIKSRALRERYEQEERKSGS